MHQLPASPFEVLASLEGYRLGFMDPGLWRPLVEQVCRKHGGRCASLRPGKAGTFPTFLVDERWAVKFFGPLFTGGTCWRVELESAALMTRLPELPVAKLVASGTLEQAGDWHYIIFEAVPGEDMAAVQGRISAKGSLKFAAWLGGVLRRMAELPVPPETTLPRLSPDRCQSWWSTRWQEDRLRWPTHLAKQVPAYLRKNRALLQAGAVHFIHADLTQDHFLGRLEGGRWTTRAVIDFGDAMLGNIFYELAALHLDLFAGDKSLLGAFLEAYRLEPAQRQDFVRKVMVTCLMHQFDVIGFLFDWRPALREETSLEALAGRLWDPEAPGL